MGRSQRLEDVAWETAGRRRGSLIGLLSHGAKEGADLGREVLHRAVGAEGFERTEGNGVSEVDAEALSPKKRECAVARPSVERSIDGDGDDWAFGAGEQEPGAALEGLEFAVGRAGAFGEDEDAAPGVEFADGAADGDGVAVFFVNRDGVEACDDPGQEGVFEEADAGDGDDVAVWERAADRGWVKMGLVVGDEDDAAEGRHAAWMV